VVKSCYCVHHLRNSNGCHLGIIGVTRLKISNLTPGDIMFIIILTHIDHLIVNPVFLEGKLDARRERRDGDSVRLNVLQA